MIQTTVLELAAVFTVAVLLAAALMALGWYCHMLHVAENQSPQPTPQRAPQPTPRRVVVPPWSRQGVTVLPAYRPAARLTRRSSHQCADRLPAAPAVWMDALADDVTRPLPLPEFPLLARSRFERTDAELKRQADRLAAKRRNRAAARNAQQAIISVPVFETAGAR
jgi:hypothetical protein